jgi:hypothetical protein
MGQSRFGRRLHDEGRFATMVGRQRVGAPLVLALGLATALPALASAEIVRRGAEFLVNTYTYGTQRRVDVASSASGQFVVVWQSFYNDPAYVNQFDVQAQRYTPAGARDGGEIDVSADPTVQDRPSVGVAADGSFVVVFEDYEESESQYRISGRRFGPGGSPVGPEFRVNTTPYTYYNTSVAMAPDGSFIVSWASYSDPDDGDRAGIRARRFDAAGTPLGNDFLVNTYTTGFQDSSQVVRAADGRFTVVWQDSARDAIVARRFDSGGAPLSGEFLVNTNPVLYPDVRAAAAPDGSLVVVWGDDNDVLGRRFDSVGGSVGGAFVVNSITTGYQSRPDVTVAPDGSFVVAWLGDGSSSYLDVFARRFDATGTPLGGDFQVNHDHQAEGGYKAPLAITGADDGTFVVVWRSAYEGYSGTDIIGQRFFNGIVACSSSPRNDCKAQTAPRGVFRLTNSTNDARDRLVWRWTKGDATDPSDFGDPLTNTAFALCVYDGSGAPQPVASAISTAQGPCPKGVLCWTALSNSPTIRYFDGAKSVDGLQEIRLRSGSVGQPRISVRAGGEKLGLPPMPLTPPVTVQLQSSDAACFSSTYQNDIKKNDGEKFRANPDAP